MVAIVRAIGAVMPAWIRRDIDRTHDVCSGPIRPVIYGRRGGIMRAAMDDPSNQSHAQADCRTSRYGSELRFEPILELVSGVCV